MNLMIGAHSVPFGLMAEVVEHPVRTHLAGDLPMLKPTAAGQRLEAVCAYLQESRMEPHGLVFLGFQKHDQADDAGHCHNNMRAAVVPDIADAAMFVLVIIGLLLARGSGWLWMDLLVGSIGTTVIASWAFGLSRDTRGILLDMNPRQHLAEWLPQKIEIDGDRLTGLHFWRLGQSHLGAVLTGKDRQPRKYPSRLRGFSTLSHMPLKVQRH